MTNSDVSASCSLETLNTADTDTNMSSLDHADIVGTVSDGQQERLQVTLDKLDNQGFLEWRHTARDWLDGPRLEEEEQLHLPTDNSLAQHGEVQEHLVEILLESEREGTTINDQC